MRSDQLTPVTFMYLIHPKVHKGFIGQAGTGKTTKLIETVEELLGSTSWMEHNALLALTFMHGSRKRLTSKLSFLKKRKIKIECQTIDSFASSLVHRYRKAIGLNSLLSVQPDLKQDFQKREDETLLSIDYVRKKAAELLSLDRVKSCIRNAYPIILIDEFQDCEEELLSLIKVLAKVNPMLLAADDFQNLNSKELSCEAVEWLRENAAIVQLKDNHRTSSSQILNSAAALRSNTKANSPIEIIAVPTVNLAAYQIAKKVQWSKWGLSGSNVVVITPVNPNKSRFVAGSLKRLNKPFGGPPKNWSLKATSIIEENTTEDELADILKLIPEFENNDSVSDAQLSMWLKIKHPVLKTAIDQCRRIIQIKGLLYIDKNKIKETLSKQLHIYRAYKLGIKNDNLICLTVHGAKNREFDYVIILWPYEVRKDELYARKLLYNAITRAKKNAMIIVQSSSDKIDFTKNPIFKLLV